MVCASTQCLDDQAQLNIEASPKLKGGSHVSDRADSCLAARLWRRWQLFRISQIGDRRVYRDLRARTNPSCNFLCFRRSALALKIQIRHVSR